MFSLARKSLEYIRHTKIGKKSSDDTYSGLGARLRSSRLSRRLWFDSVSESSSAGALIVPEVDDFGVGTAGCVEPGGEVQGVRGLIDGNTLPRATGFIAAGV